jgi:hypothetical protein
MTEIDSIECTRDAIVIAKAIAPARRISSEAKLKKAPDRGERKAGRGWGQGRGRGQGLRFAVFGPGSRSRSVLQILVPVEVVVVGFGRSPGPGRGSDEISLEIAQEKFFEMS